MVEREEIGEPPDGIERVGRLAPRQYMQQGWEGLIRQAGSLRVASEVGERSGERGVRRACGGAHERAEHCDAASQFELRAPVRMKHQIRKSRRRSLECLRRVSRAVDDSEERGDDAAVNQATAHLPMATREALDQHQDGAHPLLEGLGGAVGGRIPSELIREELQAAGVKEGVDEVRRAGVVTRES